MDVPSGVGALLDRKGRVVHTIDPEATLSACADKMLAEDVGSLVVCTDDGGLAGIITWHDLLRCAAKPEPQLNTTTVGSVMSTELATANESDSLATVEKLMVSKRIRHLPVVADGKVVGLITRLDVLRLHLSHADALSTDLEAYISGVYPPG
jgi:CBS domain-containing protein